MEQFVVERDGNRDLEFSGVVLGTGSFGTGGTSGFPGDWTRGTSVDIYRTVGGRYVVGVKQWSCYEGEGDIYRAAVCDTPADVFAWLVEDAGGRLGRASKEALEAAATEHAEIAAILTEQVE